jgi:hypothetical protein
MGIVPVIFLIIGVLLFVGLAIASKGKSEKDKERYP